MFQKYRFIKMLNKGEFSTVFLVEHRKLKCFRIVKRISKDCRYYERLMNEANILKNLCHPNIPIIYDMEEDADYSYIVEEYLEGESLKAFRLYQTFIREDVVVDIAIQFCSLFQLLHSTENPILYLDLKPDNVIINHGRIKLIDFGASIYLRQIRESEVSFGTYGYSAPEQYKIQDIDARSDIYGIGAILFFLMTGNPFSEKSIKFRKLDPSNLYSTQLKKIVLKCLRKNPNHRYQKVDQLSTAFNELNLTLPSSRPLRIAVAGTRERMGTSHICMLLASYMNLYYGDTVYVEKNEHKILPSIMKHYEEWEIIGRTITFGHCKFWLDEDFKEEQASDVNAYILDYGVACLDHKEEWEKADLILIVAGGKEWEFKDTAQCIEGFFEYKDIVYVMNHVDPKQFAKVKQIWKGREFIMAPHFPDPFFIDSTSDLKKFAEDLLKEKKYAKNYSKTKKAGWLPKR